MSFKDAWQMFSEVWKLYKRYAVRELNEVELENFTRAAEKVYQRYKKPFTKDIVVAVIGEIERSVRHFTEEENINGKS